MTRLNLGLGVVLVAVATVAYLVVGDPGTPTAASTRTATVDRGDVTAAVSGTGNLSSARSQTLSFGASGTVTEVSVEAGDTVTKGQSLATIDDGTATRSLSSAKAQLASAEASYDEVTAGQTDAEREKDELAIESAELSLSSAQASLKQAKKGTDAQAVSQAEQQVLQAKSQLAQAEADAETNAAGATDAEVAGAKVSVEEAEAAVADAQEALAGTTLRAPFAGTVVTVSGAVGDSVTAGSSGSSGSSSSTGTGSSGTSGSSGSAGAAGGGSGGSGGTSSSTTSSSSSSSGGFVVLADLTKLRVTANVAEADIGSVKAGQPATVTLSAAGEAVEGTVTAVSPEGTASNNVVQYPVTVALTTAPEGARLGASASVSITTGTASGVVRLSSSAITTLGERSTVSVVKNGVTTPTPVETGLVGGGFTEITSGVTEGQTVALPSTTTGTTGGGLPAFGGGGGPGLGGGGR